MAMSPVRSDPRTLAASLLLGALSGAAPAAICGAQPAFRASPPEDLGEDLVELVGRPVAPDGAKQRRGRDSHAHEHVDGDGAEGGHHQHASDTRSISTMASS